MQTLIIEVMLPTPSRWRIIEQRRLECCWIQVSFFRQQNCAHLGPRLSVTHQNRFSNPRTRKSSAYHSGLRPTLYQMAALVKAFSFAAVGRVRESVFLHLA